VNGNGEARIQQGLRRPGRPAQRTGTTHPKLFVLCTFTLNLFSFLSFWRHTPFVTSVGVQGVRSYFCLLTKHIWFLEVKARKRIISELHEPIGKVNRFQADGYPHPEDKSDR